MNYSKIAGSLSALVVSLISNPAFASMAVFQEFKPECIEQFAFYHNVEKPEIQIWKKKDGCWRIDDTKKIKEGEIELEEFEMFNSRRDDRNKNGVADVIFNDDTAIVYFDPKQGLRFGKKGSYI